MLKIFWRKKARMRLKEKNNSRDNFRNMKQKETDSPRNEDRHKRDRDVRKIPKYCHFWNNGSCKNGDNCSFLHKEMPPCKYQDNCYYKDTNYPFFHEVRRKSRFRNSHSKWEAPRHSMNKQSQRNRYLK